MTNSLPPKAVSIQKLYLQGGDDAQQTFEKKTMIQLKDVDPFTERVLILLLFYPFFQLLYLTTFANSISMDYDSEHILIMVAILAGHQL